MCATSKPHHCHTGEDPLAAPLVPLASRTNSIQAKVPENLQIQHSVEHNSIKETPDSKAARGSVKPTLRPLAEHLSKPESAINSILGTVDTLRCKPYEGEDIKIDDLCSVQVQNLNDGVRCPDDFFKPIVRSDPEAARDIYNPVTRIDVTTWWKDLSASNMEDLFYIHTVFQDSLKSILGGEIQDMMRTIRQDFVGGKGKCTYLDGFKVAIEDRWFHVEPENLVHVMTKKAYDFFSARQYQPDRSALMQLYLSSTDCFRGWAQDSVQKASQEGGVALRTCYDQLSQFETPAVTVASVCDHVSFLDLNYTPREGDILMLIPQYNRDGIFVQTPHPEGVEYEMEIPVQWLSWNDDIKGYTGRVPTYSAFQKSSEFNGQYSAYSHILDITLCAVFTKYCATGTAYFERTVRTRLTLGVLPKTSWSAKNSVYGIEHPLSPPLSPLEPPAFPVEYSTFGNNLSPHNALISNQSIHRSETSFGDTQHDQRYLTLPKRPPKSRQLVDLIKIPPLDNSMRQEPFKKECVVPLPPRWLVKAAEIPGGITDLRCGESHAGLIDLGNLGKEARASTPDLFQDEVLRYEKEFPDVSDHTEREDNDETMHEWDSESLSLDPNTKINVQHEEDILRATSPAREMISTIQPANQGAMQSESNMAVIGRRKTISTQASSSRPSSRTSVDSMYKGGIPTKVLEKTGNSVAIDQDGSSYVERPHRPCYVGSSLEAIPKSDLITSTGMTTPGEHKLADTIPDRRGKGPFEGRLGLEEEMALHRAIETSREEQLHSKMAALGFETSFDDIFNDDATIQVSDDDDDYPPSSTDGGYEASLDPES